eukprot:1329917-Rhodomonas_salina.1
MKRPSFALAMTAKPQQEAACVQDSMQCQVNTVPCTRGYGTPRVLVRKRIRNVEAGPSAKCECAVLRWEAGERMSSRRMIRGQSHGCRVPAERVDPMTM